MGENQIFRDPGQTCLLLQWFRTEQVSLQSLLLLFILFIPCIFIDHFSFFPLSTCIFNFLFKQVQIRINCTSTLHIMMNTHTHKLIEHNSLALQKLGFQTNNEIHQKQLSNTRHYVRSTQAYDTSRRAKDGPKYFITGKNRLSRTAVTESTVCSSTPPSIRLLFIKLL